MTERIEKTEAHSLSEGPRRNAGTVSLGLRNRRHTQPLEQSASQVIDAALHVVGGLGLNEDRLEAEGVHEVLERLRRKMGDVPGQFEAVPVAPKNTELPGIDIRNHSIKDSAGFQPPMNLVKKLPEVVDVFENIEARNYIESTTSEGSFERIASKDLGAGSSSRSLRRGSLHLDPEESPRRAHHGCQESAGTAPNV